MTGTPHPTTAEPTPLVCADDEVDVTVFVTISVWSALDIKWSISETCKNTVGYLSGPMNEGQPDEYDTTTCCLPPSTYTLVCETWSTTGWEDSKVAVNGVVYCDSIEQDETHVLNLCPNGGDCTGISTTSVSTTPPTIIITGGGSSSSTGLIPTTGSSGSGTTSSTDNDDEGNSCFFAQDGECDEHWGGCEAGTDCTDCGNCQEDNSSNQNVVQASGASSSRTAGFIALLGLLLLF